MKYIEEMEYGFGKGDGYAKNSSAVQSEIEEANRQIMRNLEKSFNRAICE